MPTWPIVPSRFWKAQVAYLARHYRVVTFDGRGSGESGRPAGAAAYTNEECAADTLAVMDAAGDRPGGAGALSCGATWAVHVAAGHPERVLGSFAIGPSCGFTLHAPGARRVRAGTSAYDHTDGLGEVQPALLAGGRLRRLPRFFFAQMFTEPHSTKQIEDCVGWGARHPPADPGRHHRRAARAATARSARRSSRCAPQVRCPVMVRARHRRPGPAARRRRAARRAHRRRRWCSRGRRPRAARRATRCWSTS